MTSTPGKPFSVRLAAIAALLALSLGAASARAGGVMQVDVPPGWRIDPGETQLTLLAPKQSVYREATLFDQPFFLPPDVDALKLLAAAAFPEGSRDVRLTGRRTRLDGWTAVEIVGSAMVVREPLALGTYFVWKGTRMIHVVVLASGSDAAPARRMAEQLARSARLAPAGTFLPVPGAPRGVIAPASWRPVKSVSGEFAATIEADDRPADPPRATLRYEILPADVSTPLPEVLASLDASARASGLRVVRTDGLETQLSGRPVTVFQQLLEPPRALLLGAIIRFPSSTVRVTYLDRRERASARRAMIDQLIERVAKTGVKGKAKAGSPAKKRATPAESR